MQQLDLSILDPNFSALRVVGVDEVGRGPLIGEVVAAAVILPHDCDLPLRDSKKLSEKSRLELSVLIKEQALAFCIASASPAEIDEINILQATLLAMQRAIAGIKMPFDKVLVDGNRCPKITAACEAIVKGDSKVMAISAASILAKVHRDQQMMALDLLYPQYGFAQHKGYPTEAHLKAIRELGLIEGYRTSFKPVKSILSQNPA